VEGVMINKVSDNKFNEGLQPVQGSGSLNSRSISIVKESDLPRSVLSSLFQGSLIKSVGHKIGQGFESIRETTGTVSNYVTRLFKSKSYYIDLSSEPKGYEKTELKQMRTNYLNEINTYRKKEIKKLGHTGSVGTEINTVIGKIKNEIDEWYAQSLSSPDNVKLFNMEEARQRVYDAIHSR
jgi:hypothetical protein